MSVVLTLGSATPRAPVASASIIETGPHPAIHGPAVLTRCPRLSRPETTPGDIRDSTNSSGA